MREYDPAKVVLTVGELKIDGFAKGSTIKVARDEDIYKKVVGADGFTVRTRNRNIAGTVTVTLLKGGPGNAKLSALLALDEANGTGVRPFQLKDFLGTELATAGECWIQKVPDLEHGDENPNREWVIGTGPLKIVVD